MIHCVSLLGIIFLPSYPAFAVPTVTANYAVALVGQSTALSCLGQNITWTHTPLMEHHEHFYINENISFKYWNWGFRMAANQNVNEKNLVIENVTNVIAGKYVCKNNSDHGKEADDNDGDNKPPSTQLIVLETLPECSVNMDEFVGPNVCNIPLDDIQLSCSVEYRGNKAPELEWRKFGESEVRKSHCTTENDSQTTCNLTVKPDLDLHGSSFVCQTTERAAKEQYSCTTKPITILHSFSCEESQQTTLPKGDEVVCVANSSMSCTYKWVWYERVDDDENRNIESKDSVLVAKRIGRHRCEAKCKLRNQTCLVFPKYVEVVSSGKNLSHNVSSQRQQALQQENKQWTTSVIGLVILGVLPYFAFGCYLFSRRRRKRTFVRERIAASE